MESAEKRAKIIAKFSSIANAVSRGAMPQFQDITVAEAIVLGLYNQKVTKYVAIFGHGSTQIAEVLRVYEEYGLVKTYNVRHEAEAAHVVTALKMRTGETAAVVTSIGPGALQAFAGSLVAASNGIGVYHIYGDETTQDEGHNMQQIPKSEQGLFLKLFGTLGTSYSLYDPNSIFTALRRGAAQTGKKGFSGPFFLLAPMNVQPAIIKDCNILEFAGEYEGTELACSDEKIFDKAAMVIKKSKRITIKIGNGAKGCGKEISELANLIDAAVVSGPSSTGIVPYAESRYMTVGGSKGSLSGNYVMNEADLVIVIGARAVCQWDCSGTAWKNARHIINFNTSTIDACHYNRSIAVIGNAKPNLKKLIETLKKKGMQSSKSASDWFKTIKVKKEEWEEFKAKRYACEPLKDKVWKMKVLTEPVAIKTVCDFADSIGAIKYFDAGDVQANGFQIVEDETEGQTYTDTGSSYMGFAASALLSGVLANDSRYAVALCGDGCFMMNPQILIDGVEHGVKACIVVFDNRRMAAISGLQNAQYPMDYKTSDSVVVDYVAMAKSVKGVKGIFGGTTVQQLKKALKEAASYDGLSLIHVPVYFGEDELASMGVFGDWNVGNWCERVQKEHHRLGL